MRNLILIIIFAILLQASQLQFEHNFKTPLSVTNRDINIFSPTLNLHCLHYL